ncbi:hypothetical protein HZA86_03650 [Candidatus Uhrbacteria bacterium]|nr:hypothetical protein [Candidatus Uhrbacteria bacterium]
MHPAETSKIVAANPQRPDAARKPSEIMLGPIVKVRRGKEGDPQRPVEEGWTIVGYDEHSGKAIVQRSDAGDGTLQKVIALTDPDLMIENPPFSPEFQRANNFVELFAALGSGKGTLWDPETRTMVSVQSIKRLINQIREEKKSIVMLPNIPGLVEKVQELDQAEFPTREDRLRQERARAQATLEGQFALLETYNNPAMQVVSGSERAAAARLWMGAYQQYLQTFPTDDKLLSFQTRYRNLHPRIKNAIDDGRVQDVTLQYEKQDALRELRRMVRPGNPHGATYNGFAIAADRLVNLLGEVVYLTKPEAEELLRMTEHAPRSGARRLDQDALRPLREKLKKQYKL